MIKLAGFALSRVSQLRLVSIHVPNFDNISLKYVFGLAFVRSDCLFFQAWFWAQISHAKNQPCSMELRFHYAIFSQPLYYSPLPMGSRLYFSSVTDRWVIGEIRHWYCMTLNIREPLLIFVNSIKFFIAFHTVNQEADLMKRITSPILLNCDIHG